MAELLGAAAVFTALALPLGIATGLFDRQTAEPMALLRAAAIALVVPALAEEIVFRGALIPDRAERSHALAAIALSTLLFVLWHVIEAHTFLAARRELLTRVDFLAIAAALGFACAILRRRSGSIWTAVVLHWAAVVGWKGWLGGPEF